jgi:hypothetical protein
VAEAIVKDYCNGILACNMGDVMPGLFYLMGRKTQADILKDHKQDLANADKKQRRWYEALVTMGDVEWARSQGNPLSVSDSMRHAAREIGQNDKPWIMDYQATQVIRCVACGSLRNPAYPVCPTCKAVVEVDKVKALGLKFVE